MDEQEKAELLEKLVEKTVDAAIKQLKASGHSPDQKEIDGIKEKMSEEFAASSDLEKLTKSVQEAVEKANALEAKNVELQKQLDETGEEVQKAKLKRASTEKPENVKSLIHSFLSGDKYKSYAEKGGVGTVSEQLTTKADISFGGNFVNDVVEPMRVQQRPIFQPDPPFDIRTVFPARAASKKTISYNKETAYTDGLGMLGENDPSVASNLTVEEIQKIAKRLATHVDVSRDALDDIDFLSSYLTARVEEKLITELTNQCINGDGTGNNIDGLFNNAATFTAGAFATEIQAPTLADLLWVARTNLFVNNNIMANGILVNPIDATKMALTKNAENDYVNLDVIVTRDTNGVTRVNGIPLFEVTQVVEDTYLIGDMRELTAQLFAYRNISMRISEDNGTNAIENQVTFVFESQWNFPVYADFRLLKGTISTDIAAITAP